MIVDKRFQNSVLLMLRGLIGKRLICYKCDPFRFSNMVYKKIGFQIEENAYLLKNEISPQPYFGVLEDICNFDFIHVQEQDICSGLAGVTQITMPVEAVISKISILNETRSMYAAGALVDEYHFVRGVVITVEDGREYSFEKSDDFSEEVIIRRGNHLLDQFSPIEQGVDAETGMDFRVTRAVQTIQ